MKEKLIISLIFLLIILPVGFSVNISLVYYNGTLANLSYDRINATLGSFSYKDNSIVNPNVYLKICGLNQTMNSTFVDFLYSSEDGNISISILTQRPQIYNITNNCTLIDIDISAFKALYPAIPFVAIYKLNETSYFSNETNQTVTNVSLERIYFSKLNNTWLKGSYLVGVDIDDITKQTFLTVQKIFDQNKTQIVNSTKPYLIFTIVLDGNAIKEKVGRPRVPVVFNYHFTSSEVVYINGIPSLRVKVIPPCTIINETGYYYIINSSAWNLNSSCLRIENVSNIVVDFANKTIDGDASINGSMRKNLCGITVKNSANLTLKDVRAQQFFNGVCVFNSQNIKIFGTQAEANVEGIYIKNSSVRISSIWLKNNDSEIFAKENSLLQLSNVHFATANLSATTKDVIIKNVFNPPKDPEGLINISQWINITKNGESWIDTLTFHFIFPNPQGILPKTIYKFEGRWINGSWQNESWEALYPTYVDVPNRMIFSPINLTNFSIFIPYGEKVNITKPKPTPTPAPSAITGGAPQAIPPKLKLELMNKTITIQQGATGEVWFNLTNIADVDISDVRVDAQVRRGWKRTFKDFDVVRKGESKIDKLLISVYENEVPGVYWIPIKAMLKQNNVTVDIKLLKVIVVPRKRIARVDILEIPSFLFLPEYSSSSVALLVKNTGDYDLKKVWLVIENGENCISKIDGVHSLKVGEKKSISFTLHTKGAHTKCDTVFVLQSEKGPVALYPVIIEIRPSLKARSLFYFIKLLPILLVIWSIITIYVWRKK